MPNLYNKYRPQRFSEIVGQPAVVKTLRNQIRTRSFSHAYLFTGTRGTGKTTCARILARAVNCENVNDGEPCNECALCRDFIKSASSDIVEIDAASNSGVDNIRKMTEEITYMPIAAKYKVYIIDEVHMLSASAFNSLLKTLEEPPSHAVFILATTEIHKVPATIQSRCQRFDFYRIRTSEIAERLKKIAELEKRTLPESSLFTIAEMGDGSMRDAISVLDKVLELSTEEEIREVLGIADKTTTFDIIRAVAENDTQTLLLKINELYYKIGDFSYLCRDMLAQLRSMLIIKNVDDYKSLLDMSENSADILADLAGLFTTEKIIFAMKVLQQTAAQLSFSSNKRDDMEICLLKIAKPGLDISAEALSARIAELEKTLSGALSEISVQKTRTGASGKKSARNPGQEKEQTISEAENGAAAPVTDKKRESAVENKKSDVPPPDKGQSGPLPGAGKITDKFHEYLLWDDICSIIRPKAIRAATELRDYAIPLVRGGEIVIVCTDEGTKRLADKNMDIIKQAFAAHKKNPESIRSVVGRKQDFIDETDIYDNLENNEFLKFE